MNVLEIRKLKISYGPQPCISFAYPDIVLQRGRCLCIRGPVGCGKTTMVNSLFSRSFKGKTQYEKAELLGRDIREWGSKLYGVMSYMPQHSQNALNPYATIGKHIKHIQNGNKSTCSYRELLGRLELEAGITGKYPHQLSGGMKQRLVMLLGFLKNPELFVIDEPSTAIDPVTLRLILDFLKQKKAEGTTMLMITHDRGLAAHMSDESIDLEGAASE